MIENKTLIALEFDKILWQLSKHAVSPRARDYILELCPENDFGTVKLLLSQTQEAYDVIYKYNLNPIVEFDEVDEIMGKAKIGATLQMSELIKVRRILRSSRIAKKTILNCEQTSNLRKIVANIMINEELENKINDSIASENEMKDDASLTLKNIRRKILATNNKLKDKLNSYCKSNEVSKYLQDNLVTIRNGRFVLPVRAEYKTTVGGLIHDQSSSGSTVFIEPFAVVEMNNELQTLKSEEEAEIDRILKVLSGEVFLVHEMISINQENITLLDIVFSKCKYSVTYNGIVPLLNNNKNIVINSGRHLLLSKDSVVPVDIRLGNEYNFMLITGPNTGGKTVCLKMLGLFCLMTYCGLMLPVAENSSICIYDNIFCDIGDEQSIEQSLSTFSSHINNLVRITNNITSESLVLIDEIGAGTDPTEGASLAIGIIEYLQLVNCSGIITTHYSHLKEYALLNKKIINASMQFDELTLRPTYRLIIGMPGVSNALKIAKTLGINDFIIKKSYENINNEKIMFEEVLRQAEIIKSQAIKEFEKISQDKHAISEQYQAVETQKNKIEQTLMRINNDAKVETKKIVRKSVEKAEELIEEIKILVSNANEASLLEAKRLRTKLNDLQYENDGETFNINYQKMQVEEMSCNKRCVVISLNSDAIIKSTDFKKKKILVAIGNMETYVDITDIGKRIENAGKIKLEKKKTFSTTLVARKTELELQEIKVLGLTVNEAIEEIEPLVERNINSLNKIIKIVHGKGTGALGRGIQNYYKKNALVSEVRYGRYGEGDNGVTFITLK